MFRSVIVLFLLWIVAVSCAQKGSTPISQEKLAAGGRHNCILLMKDGIQGVKCWGINTNGQLGLGHTDNQGDDPNEIEGLALTEIL